MISLAFRAVWSCLIIWPGCPFALLCRNLGKNRFPVFPSIGLENALHISVHNNSNLREFPGPAAFPRVQKLELSYAYHCCAFLNPSYYAPYADENTNIQDTVIFLPNQHGIDLVDWTNAETSQCGRATFF